MTYRDPAITTALSALQAHFEATDALRCLRGDAMASLGLGPRVYPYQVTASGSHWRLRDYGNRDATQSLLIVAAPIKHPNIWDRAPPLSAVSFCLEQGLHVRLIEWLPASRETDNIGFDECIQAIDHRAALALREDVGAKSFLAGHSLGGTLAAIYAAKSSDSIPLPGSLLTHTSALASPATFVWSRLFDGMMCLGDEHAVEIHARVVRWALDEIALPGKLMREMIERLYWDNLFVSGTLQIGAQIVGPFTLTVPLIAGVNTADDVAPIALLKPFTDALPANNVHVLEFPGEIGTCLQHLALPVGREARVTIWPEIMAWSPFP